VTVLAAFLTGFCGLRFYRRYSTNDTDLEEQLLTGDYIKLNDELAQSILSDVKKSARKSRSP